MKDYLTRILKNTNNLDIQKHLKLLSVQPFFLNNYQNMQENQQNQVENKLFANLVHADKFYSELKKLNQQHQIPIQNLFELYWIFILPFHQNLLEKRILNQNTPQMIKCLGIPGVGKTAFGSIFKRLAEFEGQNVISASTDDFYLEYEERKQLQEKDPRYIQRGPPGTIDTQLMQQVTKQMSQYTGTQNNVIEVPIFDKSVRNGFGDRTDYQIIDKKVDFFVLEGWFTGCRYQEETDEFRQKVQQICSTQEKQNFAIEQNNLLKDFQKTWDLFDTQLILTPEDFKYMFYYRQEAEYKLIKQKGSGLTEKQIHDLMSYFYESLCPEIYINDMIEQRNIDLYVEFNKQRNLTKIQAFK